MSINKLISQWDLIPSRQLQALKNELSSKVLKIYNTPTSEKKEFQSISPNEVKMYSCWPTVYSDAHIWNLRSYIFPDILKKILTITWYKVKHIINITDVWHLTDDASDWDDKMELRARKIWNTVWDISKRYTKAFIDDIQKLNIALPESFTKATDYIKEQIEMISILEQKWYTYTTSDWVYFDTKKFPEYHIFWKLDIENLNKWERVNFWEKRSVTDFALWKFSPQNEKRQMERESPWGIWFPWWHIECSAMIQKVLWDKIDIHTWWTDHIKVHHTNEIAQAKCCTWKDPVNYWLHWQFLVLDNEKRIWKSEWNSIKLSTLIEKWYNPLSYRYLVLMAHYRSFLTFSEDILLQAENGLKKLKAEIESIYNSSDLDKGFQVNQNAIDYLNTIFDELLDDLNTPKALAKFRSLLKDDSVSNEEKVIITHLLDQVLSLWLLQFSEDQIPDEILELANKRWTCKKEKDFKNADKIRKELETQWYMINDSKDSFTVSKM